MSGLGAASKHFYRTTKFTRTEQAVQWTQEAQACLSAFTRYGVGYPHAVDASTERQNEASEGSTGGGEAMRTYERPTLTAAGSFKKVTGTGGHGPKDFLTKKQLL